MYCNLSSLLRSSLSSRRLCSSGGDEGKEKESEKGRGTPKHEKDTAAAAASALSHGHSGDDDDEVDAEDEVDAAAEGGELNQIQTAIRVEVLNTIWPGRACGCTQPFLQLSAEIFAPINKLYNL